MKYVHMTDEAFEGQTEVVIKSMHHVQKNIFNIAKSNISKAKCHYKSDYDKKHCGKGKVQEFEYVSVYGTFYTKMGLVHGFYFIT